MNKEVVDRAINRLEHIRDQFPSTSSTYEELNEDVMELRLMRVFCFDHLPEIEKTAKQKYDEAEVGTGHWLYSQGCWHTAESIRINCLTYGLD